jgi:hypothetical protein
MMRPCLDDTGALRLTVPASIAPGRAKCCAAPAEFLAVPDLAAAAGAQIAGRSIGLNLLLRKG